MAISQKIIDQYNLLRESLPDVRAHPADWLVRGEDYEYLYREGTLLVRDADEPAVAEFLRETLNLRELDPDSPDDEDSIGRMRDGETLDSRVYLAEHPIEGLTRLRFAGARSADGGGSVPDMLAQVEAAGNRAGMFRPEAVLHICGNCCPADEPGSVSQQMVDPIPPVATDCGCKPPCDGDGVRVRIIDTGWIPTAAAQRPWLNGVDGEDESSYEEGRPNVIKDYAGHGTFTAGCVRVVAPKATVYVNGTMTTAGAKYDTELVKELEEALKDEADAVVVFPFSTTTPDNKTLAGFDRLYENLLRQKIEEEGMVILSSAGCDDTDTPSFPAKYPWVTSVGALERRDEPVKAHFSNYGDSVDVYVVGEGLVNAYATGTLSCKEHPNQGVQRDFNGLAQWSGTSFATALFGGMIAARKAHTKQTARAAADSLLALAQSQRVEGLDRVLRVDQACAAVADRAD
jgi:subtilisin family serine protease